MNHYQIGRDESLCVDYFSTIQPQCGSAAPPRRAPVTPHSLGAASGPTCIILSLHRIPMGSQHLPHSLRHLSIFSANQRVIY